VGGTAANTNSLLGGAAAVGGAASIGGVSPTLGGASAGGAAATGGVAMSTGGAAITAGGTNAIASSTTVHAGSTSVSTGGTTPATGGASACTKATDCTNPDPINCSYTCENPGASGTCKPAALVGPTQCITADCPVKPISGFWDADGKPHIAYGWTESDGTASIRMQQVGLDGTQVGAAVAYRLPALQSEPALLSAAAQGVRVAFLWTGIQGLSGGASNDVAQFALTNVTGASSTPATLASSPGGIGVASVSLTVTPAGAWLALADQGVTVHSLDAATGSSIAAWSGMSPVLFDGMFSAGVVGNTLMLTGANCASYSGCTRSFVLQRYSAASLSSIGSSITLSQNFQSDEHEVMGPLNGQMALLWTETQSPASFFRTLIKEDGTFAVGVGTVQSAVQPKAIVESTDGGALLIGTIVSGSPASYRVIAQRLDANLALIGSPFPVADGETDDATGFETHISADGSHVLVTYTQVGVRYRVMSTNFCR